MSSRLPDLSDPRLLCDQGKSFEGRISLGSLPRLAPLLASSEGEAVFVLEFDRDEERRARVRGTVKAVLMLECQRCLEPMEFPVDADMLLAVVSGPEEAGRLPDEYDPLLVEEGRMPLMDIIEDELVLAIPPAPRHEPDVCGVELPGSEAEPEAEQDATEQENPFAAALAAALETDKKQH
jgi:uncharacterized protein